MSDLSSYSSLDVSKRTPINDPKLSAFPDAMSRVRDIETRVDLLRSLTSPTSSDRAIMNTDLTTIIRAINANPSLSEDIFQEVDEAFMSSITEAYGSHGLGHLTLGSITSSDAFSTLGHVLQETGGRESGKEIYLRICLQKFDRVAKKYDILKESPLSKNIGDLSEVFARLKKQPNHDAFVREMIRIEQDSGYVGVVEFLRTALCEGVAVDEVLQSAQELQKKYTTDKTEYWDLHTIIAEAQTALRVPSGSTGVSLSGGAAHGFAEIGVLAAREDADKSAPDVISGISIGALNGAFLATGLSAHDLGVYYTKGFDLAGIHYELRSLDMGDAEGRKKIMAFFTALWQKLGYNENTTFSDLKIPCTVTAGRVYKGEDSKEKWQEVVFGGSDRVMDAVRASIAVKDTFDPVSIEGQKFNDFCGPWLGNPTEALRMSRPSHIVSIDSGYTSDGYHGVIRPSTAFVSKVIVPMMGDTYAERRDNFVRATTEVSGGEMYDTDTIPVGDVGFVGNHFDADAIAALITKGREAYIKKRDPFAFVQQ